MKTFERSIRTRMNEATLDCIEPPKTNKKNVIMTALSGRQPDMCKNYIDISAFWGKVERDITDITPGSFHMSMIPKDSRFHDPIFPFSDSQAAVFRSREFDIKRMKRIFESTRSHRQQGYHEVKFLLSSLVLEKISNLKFKISFLRKH